MTQISLTVGLGTRAYDFTIGPELIDQAGTMLGKIAADRHIVIISDEQVAALHLASLQASLTKTARKIDALTVPAGESSKSMSVLARLLDDILALGVDRLLMVMMQADTLDAVIPFR